MSLHLRRGALIAQTLLLVACSGPSGGATATSGARETPTEAVLAATSPATETTAPTATATASPTATSKPTATSEPTPTEASPTPTEPEPTPTATEAAEPTPTEEATEPLDSEGETSPVDESADFAAQVDALLADREGHYHVVVSGPGGAPDYHHDDGMQVQAASLFKLLIMVEVFRQVKEGWITFDDQVMLYSGYFSEAGYDDPFQPQYIGDSVPVEDLVRPMIMLSSNVAAYALLDLVGNTNINATAESLGMTSSEIRWMPRRVAGADRDTALAALAVEETPAPSAEEAFNVTSAADMALLFEGLLVISPEASEQMLEILSGQVVNDRLPALLPSGTTVAHKTGNIDNVIHDAGVIYAPGGPVVVVVLTADAWEWEAVEFMRELALLVYQHTGG